MAIDNLTPVTRTEGFLDGDDLTPVTRLEYFLQKAGSGGGSSDLPEYTAADAGEVLTVSAGGSSLEWAAVPTELPAHTVYDVGKVLKIDGYNTPQWSDPLYYIRFTWTEDNGSWTVDSYEFPDVPSVIDEIASNDNIPVLVRHTFTDGTNETAAEGTALTYTDGNDITHLVSMVFGPATNSLKVYKVDVYYDENATENVYTTAINTIALT